MDDEKEGNISTLMQRPFLFLSFFAQVCMRWPFVRYIRIPIRVCVCLRVECIQWVSVTVSNSPNLYLSIIQIIIIYV